MAIPGRESQRIATSGWGISAIVDAHGRVVAEAPLEAATTLAGTVYPAQVVTGYVRFGDWIVLAGAIALGWDAIRRTLRRTGPAQRSDQSA